MQRRDARAYGTNGNAAPRAGGYRGYYYDDEADFFVQPRQNVRQTPRNPPPRQRDGAYNAAAGRPPARYDTISSGRQNQTSQRAYSGINRSAPKNPPQVQRARDDANRSARNIKSAPHTRSDTNRINRQTPPPPRTRDNTHGNNRQTASRTRSASNAHMREPMYSRTVTSRPRPVAPSRRNPYARHRNPPNIAALVMVSSILLLVILFMITNSIGKSAANGYITQPTAAPIGSLATPESVAASAMPIITPLLVYRTSPETTPYVADILIDTLNEIATTHSNMASQDDAIPAGGYQETPSQPVSSIYTTISDDLIIDETGRAGTAGDPNALPLLVNASNRLSSSWTPDNLVYLTEYCPSDIVKIKGIEIQGEREAVDAMLTMFSDAIAQGLSNWQISAGYRSYTYQQSLFNERVTQYMTDNGMSREKAVTAASQYVASPGASEHHTGLAFDVTVPGRTFESTEQCAWLAKHCAEYGFIIRYTADKVSVTGIEAEPWHIRYVGVEHAKAITQAHLALEEYVELLLSKRAVN